jgi:hypothetical protein
MTDLTHCLRLTFTGHGAINMNGPVTSRGVSVIIAASPSSLLSEQTCAFALLSISQPVLSSRLLSKDVKVRIYKTIICLWFYMGVKHGL